MNFKKKISAIFIIGMISTIAIGCTNNTMNKVYDDNSSISSEYDSWGLNDNNETAEIGSYEGSMKLSGHGTVWAYESNEDMNLEVPYKLTVKSGKAKIVLITPDNEVTTLIESTKDSNIEEDGKLILPIKKGTNRIKIVGYNKAEIDVELNIDRGSFVKIGFE